MGVSDSQVRLPYGLEGPRQAHSSESRMHVSTTVFPLDQDTGQWNKSTFGCQQLGGFARLVAAGASMYVQDCFPPLPTTRISGAWVSKIAAWVSKSARLQDCSLRLLSVRIQMGRSPFFSDGDSESGVRIAMNHAICVFMVPNLPIAHLLRDECYE